jgi:Initiator Rep protein, WH2/Initiator Replication protein, WH1
LKPYLLHLKDQFTSIALQYAIQLRSVYAIRIYELLKQYQRLRQRTLAVAELRRMLAIDEHKYTLIKDFRRRVIDIAQREINGKTDLCFEYEPIKTGRKITHFRFRIAANVSVPAPAVADNPEQAKLVRRLEAHGVIPAEAGRLAASYAPERIAWHLAELQRRLKSRRPIANPAAWLVQGIRDDYRPHPSMFAQADEQRRSAIRVEPTLLNAAATFFCERYPATFLSKAAYARQHDLGDPEILGAELAEIESETSHQTKTATAAS